MLKKIHHIADTQKSR